uniref:Uncharacterized protein n=1 Tax=Ditylenchus dipsaci TaxID=166011 RepID=A0A915CW87_9BILA
MRRRAIADRFEINRIKRQAIVDRKADRFEMSRREQIHIEQIHEMRVMLNKFWVALAMLMAIVLILLSERIYAFL